MKRRARSASAILLIVFAMFGEAIGDPLSYTKPYLAIVSDPSHLQAYINAFILLAINTLFVIAQRDAILGATPGSFLKTLPYSAPFEFVVRAIVVQYASIPTLIFTVGAFAYAIRFQHTPSVLWVIVAVYLVSASIAILFTRWDLADGLVQRLSMFSRRIGNATEPNAATNCANSWIRNAIVPILLWRSHRSKLALLCGAQLVVIAGSVFVMGLNLDETRNIGLTFFTLFLLAAFSATISIPAAQEYKLGAHFFASLPSAKWGWSSSCILLAAAAYTVSAAVLYANIFIHGILPVGRISPIWVVAQFPTVILMAPAIFHERPNSTALGAIAGTCLFVVAIYCV
ncbi:MAG: hypothetical protein JO142_21630 [Burkholderiales bacterium]|nr:hypothetical protein [Burkholderiales bacterium]